MEQYKTGTGTDPHIVKHFQSELSRHIYWADNITQTQCMTIVNNKTEKRHQLRLRTAPEFKVRQAF